MEPQAFNPEAFRFTLDERAPAEGRRSLCIERVADEPWALATQAVPPAGVRGARVRLSMAVRGEARSLQCGEANGHPGHVTRRRG